jgi:ABC-type lipoprotein export system ATPase subunit
MITLHNLSRTYATSNGPLHAVRDLDLELPEGAFIVFMGASGSGKTTLLNLIGGLDRPTTGRITIAEHDLAALSASQRTHLRRRIGFIFQGFALLPTATAYENIEIGLRLACSLPRPEWDAAIRASIHAVELDAWINHRPYEMSGGQQQRVAIARALAIRPQLILADEPTGDLDRRLSDHVWRLLHAHADASGATVLAATHDPAAVRYASICYTLEAGRIVRIAPGA